MAQLSAQPKEVQRLGWQMSYKPPGPFKHPVNTECSFEQKYEKKKRKYFCDLILKGVLEGFFNLFLIHW